MECAAPPDYAHYIENENQALPATAIHRHARAGYHTTKPGEKLVPGRTIDFDLSDPFFMEYKPEEYSSLHDQHLKHFLNKKSVRRCLIKNNLITKDGYVKCTRQEFNRFQRNLKHYFKIQKRIAASMEKKFIDIDHARKTIRNKIKETMLQKRIQHNIKIAEARARHSETMMKRRKHIMNSIVQKDRQVSELITRVRLEREEVQGQAKLEMKRRELLRIRLDSTELIRRHTILQRIGEKERIVNQKQLLKKQRRIKEIKKTKLGWHVDRIFAKNEETGKMVTGEMCREEERKRSISNRTIQAQENKNKVLERQKMVFNQHQRIEDIHLEEARQWEKRVEHKRAMAANNWRAKMHCMQSIAEGRMADIEERMCERRNNALARKKAQIEEDLDELEKMDVTVLGTTGCGSNELANIHRDNSNIRFSTYCDPGRDTVDPCRLTQFHSFFKPLHVTHAKYQPGHVMKPTKLVNVPEKTPKKVVVDRILSTLVSSIAPTPDMDDVTDGMMEDLLEEMIKCELTNMLEEPMEGIMESEGNFVSKEIIEYLLETVDKTVSPDSPTKVKIVQLESNFTLASDQSEHTYDSEDFSSADYGSSLFNLDNLIQDVVKKIMACFEGKHDEVYRGQTSTTDCSERDGEEIITDILTRLIATIHEYTTPCYTTGTIIDSAESMLSSTNTLSRDSLKDLHKRAQFLLNHALDVAKVKLKMRGYSYLTWNILEDSLMKSKDKILAENKEKVTQLNDVQLVDWIVDEAKIFLRGATTLLYEMLHDPDVEESQSSVNVKLVEACYLDQLKKMENANRNREALFDAAIFEQYRDDGDVAKFAILLVQKTLHNAALGIPRRSSIMLTEALLQGNYDLAGSILSAKVISVAHKDLVFDPQTTSAIDLRKALRLGDVEQAGTMLANKAIQRAMEISVESDSPLEVDISNMILEHALQQSDVNADDMVVDQSLREALDQLSARTPEAISIFKNALQEGDLEVAATCMIEAALTKGMRQLVEEEHGDLADIRRESSIVLDKALMEGDMGAAGDVMTSRALRSGLASLLSPDPAFMDANGQCEIRRESSVLLDKALMEGDVNIAGDVMTSRALRSGMAEIMSPEIRRESSVLLDKALMEGDMQVAGDVLTSRALRSGVAVVLSPETLSSLHLQESPDQKDLELARDMLANRLKISNSLFVGAENLMKKDSSIVLTQLLTVGDLEAAAPILINRALLNGMSIVSAPPSPDLRNVSSTVLDAALNSGDLETAGSVMTGRALRSGMRSASPATSSPEISGSPVELSSKSPSEDALEKALNEGDLDVAGGILTNRAIRSASPLLSEHSVSGQQEPDPLQVMSVHSYEELDVRKPVSLNQDSPISARVTMMDVIKDTTRHLESNAKLEDSGSHSSVFFKRIVDESTQWIEKAFVMDTKFSMISNALIPRDFGEVAAILVKLLLDSVRAAVRSNLEENEGISNEFEATLTRFVMLICRRMMESAIESVRGNFSWEMGYDAGQRIDAYLRDAITAVNLNTTGGVNSIIATILGTGLSLLVCPTSKQPRRISSVELFEAARSGNKPLASSILASKVLRKAQETLFHNEDDGKISKYRSATDILNENAKKKRSSTTLIPRKVSSRKKINEEGLPRPPPPPPPNPAYSPSYEYEPRRDMLMAEEREARINKIISSSKKSLTSDTSANKRHSDTDLKAKCSIERLSESCKNKMAMSHEEDDEDITSSASDIPHSLYGASPSYIRKIQSKGHVYYIDSEGAIKKRTKKKRSSKKRSSQDVIQEQIIDEERATSDLDFSGPHSRTVSPESGLIQPSPPGIKPSDASKRSLECRRGSFKKKDSNLQMLAVINSSYTNMMGGKKTSSTSSSLSSEVSQNKKLSIDDLLSDTDKELILKLSCDSLHSKKFAYASAGSESD